MNKWVVRLYHHPLSRLGEGLRLHSTQAVSQWLVNRAEPIDRVTPELITQAIKRVIWRILINGAIVCWLLSMAIASGYLKFQLPDPQNRNLLLSIGAVGGNLLLTQSLNFQKFTSIISFALCLGGSIVLAHFLPSVHSVIMYLYTSWLLLFLVPIYYWLMTAAFDLAKFRNLLMMVATIVSMLVYSLAAMVQLSDWQIGLDVLSIANRVSLYTAIGCLAIFIIFGSIAKLWQVSLKLTILSIREILNRGEGSGYE